MCEAYFLEALVPNQVPPSGAVSASSQSAWWQGPPWSWTGRTSRSGGPQAGTGLPAVLVRLHRHYRAPWTGGFDAAPSPFLLEADVGARGVHPRPLSLAHRSSSLCPCGVIPPCPCPHIILEGRWLCSVKPY